MGVNFKLSATAVNTPRNKVANERHEHSIVDRIQSFYIIPAKEPHVIKRERKGIEKIQKISKKNQTIITND